MKNGDVLAFREKGIVKVGTVPSGKMCIDGSLLRNAESKVLKERLILSRSGTVLVTIIVNSKGNLVFAPSFETIGFLDKIEDEEIYDEFEFCVKKEIKGVLESFTKKEKISEGDVVFRVSKKFNFGF